MKVEAQVNIKSDRSAVWRAITSIQNADGIISGIEKVEILNEPTGGITGLKWKETRLYFGKHSTIDKWVTDAVDNEFYSTRAEMDGFVFITTMTILEKGGIISLTSTHETQSQNIIARLKSIPMIFFKGVLRKAIVRDLNDIKSAVEQNRY